MRQKATSLFELFMGQTEVLSHRNRLVADLLAIVQRRVRATACSLRFVEGDLLTEGIAIGYAHPRLRKKSIRIDRRLEKWLGQSEMWICRNIEDAQIPRERKNYWLKQGFHSAVMVPLQNGRGRTFAVLTVFFDRSTHIRRETLPVLQTLQDILAYGLDHSFLYDDIVELQQLARHIVEFTTDAILITDELGRIQFVSSRAAKLFHRRRHTLEGRLIFQLGGEADVRFEEALRTVRRKRHPHYFEFDLEQKHSASAYLQASVARISLERADKEILLWMFRDLTTLRRAQEKVERKEAEMENFVYSVSHDLKTPLISVQGYVSLLKAELENAVSNQVKHYLERIDANVFSMQHMIQDLLELSRVSRGKQEVGTHLVSNILRQALDEYRYQIERKKVILRVPKRLPRIVCDARGIRLIFSNLIGNAIKFMGKQKSPIVEIGWQKSNHEHIFYVRDNGAGILPEDQPKVFHVFYRAKSQASVEGTGVGLAIVKKIVENHGGRVWVESEAGKGSTFYFTIPLRTNSLLTTGNTGL